MDEEHPDWRESLLSITCVVFERSSRLACLRRSYNKRGLRDVVTTVPVTENECIPGPEQYTGDGQRFLALARVCQGTLPPTRCFVVVFTALFARVQSYRGLLRRLEGLHAAALYVDRWR